MKSSVMRTKFMMTIVKFFVFFVGQHPNLEVTVDGESRGDHVIYEITEAFGCGVGNCSSIVKL
jgi:hypothetical protein